MYMSLINHRDYYSGDAAEMVDAAYMMRCLAGDDTSGALFGVWVTLTLLAENDFATAEQFQDMVCECVRHPEAMNARLNMLSPYVGNRHDEGE